MTWRQYAPTALVFLGVVLLLAPAAVPVQPHLTQTAQPGTILDEAALEEEGYTVVAYENLSDRGKAIYRATLREGGSYTLPSGAGAAEFPYPSGEDLSDVEDYRQREIQSSVVIERPPDVDLPPADEPVGMAGLDEGDGQEVGGGAEPPAQREGGPRGDGPNVTRAQIARYDVVETRTERPGMGARANLLRLLSVVLGVLALVTGGYYRSLPRSRDG